MPSAAVSGLLDPSCGSGPAVHYSVFFTGEDRFSQVGQGPGPDDLGAPPVLAAATSRFPVPTSRADGPSTLHARRSRAWASQPGPSRIPLPMGLTDHTGRPRTWAMPNTPSSPGAKLLFFKRDFYRKQMEVFQLIYLRGKEKTELPSVYHTQDRSQEAATQYRYSAGTQYGSCHCCHQSVQ